jgi:hypothetical protein
MPRMMSPWISAALGDGVELPRGIWVAMVDVRDVRRAV